MRATNIEQIREHLARGGRVTVSSPNWDTMREVERVGGNSAIWFASGGAIWFDKRLDWELLPIEEERCTLRTYLGELDENGNEVSKVRVPNLGWRDSGTLRIGTERPITRKRVQILIEGNDTGAGERIRNALLFGRHPMMEDLLAWWQATTGEKIEHGRRCDACKGEGKQISRTLLEKVDCPACQRSPGYAVAPTWMQERKATGDE